MVGEWSGGELAAIFLSVISIMISGAAAVFGLIVLRRAERRDVELQENFVRDLAEFQKDAKAAFEQKQNRQQDTGTKLRRAKLARAS